MLRPRNRKYLLVSFIVLVILIALVSIKMLLKPDSPSSQASPIGCTPHSLGLKKSPLAALFLQEVKKQGYEGIVRKSTKDGQVVFDIVTNQLPESFAPYKVWVAYPNEEGKVCGSVLVGDMTLEPSMKVWTIVFDSTVYHDDANVILITSGNIDGNNTEITSLEDPRIILRGFFGQTENVSEPTSP